MVDDVGFNRVGMLVAVAAVGRGFLSVLSAVGRAGIFCLRSIYHSVVPPYYFVLTLKQFAEMWFLSLPIVGVASIFTGGALILQDTLVGGGKVAGGIMSGIVTVAIVRELGPVLMGLIVAGRVGAAMAAELGTMRITEQIDALTTLDADPFHYLVAPRLLALTFAMPVLVLYTDVLGVFGGYLVGIMGLGYSPEEYLGGVGEFLHYVDVLEGLLKATSFGFVISMVGCYSGYYCGGGARGVGLATTNTVVASSMLIVLLNYMITMFYK